MLRTLAILTLVSSVNLVAKPFVEREVWDSLRDEDLPSSTVVVTLKDEFDLSKLPQFKKNQIEQGRKVAEILEEHTKASISNTFPFLIVGPNTGVEEVTPLWINNSVRVKARPEVIKKLTSWWGVETIQLERRKEVSEMQDIGMGTLNFVKTWAPTVAWGVEKVRAPELWNSEIDGTRIDGSGVLVAMIDSGVNLAHPDLAANIYKNKGEMGLDASGKDKSTNGIDDDNNGFIDDVNGWNFEDKTNDPTDRQGHGTQTAGIVGGNGTGGNQTGVAPKATLIPLRACCDLGGKAGETAIMEAMQYAIKMGAKVISMSLSIKHYSSPSYAIWRRASETMLAAGVIHINSAGNRGNGNEPNNIGAPATNPPPWFHEKQVKGTRPTSMIVIGATDQNDKLRNYSSVGPVTWEDIPEYKDFPYEKGAKPGLIRPDVCGPSEVPSTSMDGKSYTTSFGGTSSATPHVGGVVALMVQVKPDLSPAEALEALQMSSIPVEGGAFSSKCGAGRVDSFAAVEYVRAHFKR